MQKKTPKRLSYLERETKILDAAITLFSKMGFEGTTTKAIAAEAKINEALLFRHFQNKEELYTALLKRKLSDFETQIIPALEKVRNKNLPEVLYEISRMMIQRNRKDPAFFRMMLFSSLENHRLSRLFYKQRLPLIEFLESIFAERVRINEIKPFAPTILARAFFGMIHHYILVNDIFKAKRYYPGTSNEIIKNYIAIFTKGIMP
jgi:AcrR family transcriptional regulator